jgi:hypothetical protein
MSNKNTPSSPPAVDSQPSTLPLDDIELNNYLSLLRTKSSKKRQHDEEEETRSTKRCNKENVPLRNADAPEPAAPNPHLVGKNRPGPGKGKKRPNENEDDERRVKQRVAADEEECDNEYLKTFRFKMSLPNASTARCTPDDENREMFRKAKREAEKVGFIFLSFSFS